MNAIITPGWPLRLFLLVLNIASLAFGLILVKGDKNMVSGRAVKVTIILYTLLNFLAVIANIAGRLTLAKIFTSAAVIGLTQMIGLFVIVEILIEAFYLQMQSSRISVG
jgi:hypothetical protein